MYFTDTTYTSYTDTTITPSDSFADTTLTLSNSLVDNNIILYNNLKTDNKNNEGQSNLASLQTGGSALNLPIPVETRAPV